MYVYIHISVVMVCVEKITDCAEKIAKKIEPKKWKEENEVNFSKFGQK